MLNSAESSGLKKYLLDLEMQQNWVPLAGQQLYDSGLNNDSLNSANLRMRSNVLIHYGSRPIVPRALDLCWLMH